MNGLSLGQWNPYAPRRFVPAEIDLGDWGALAPLFDRLEERAAQCSTPAELEQWLLDGGEINAALEEEGTRRYIAMTCQTADPAQEAAYLHFIEAIEPQLKPRRARLARLYLEHPQRQGLPASRYAVFERNMRVQVELFRPENVPLETEEAKLGQQYQKLTGSLAVTFQGEERTLPQMGRFLEEPDRALRQAAWEAVARRRLHEAERFETWFDQLLELRQRLAVQAGFPNYLEYAFRLRGRFDYTPADCRRFHAAIAEEVMPVVRCVQAERQRQLFNAPPAGGRSNAGDAAGPAPILPRLRPWDLAVDPLNRPPLRPFATAEDLVERARRVFQQLDPELDRGFELMRERHLLDLENRKGKAPGGYQSTLAEARLPFIFMNAVGLQRDVETLLHEAGHAFHALATQPEPLWAYRDAPIEFCEVASMSMELLGADYLNAFYAEPDARRARHDHLEGIVTLFPWVATVDAFQHWLYTHPGHSRAERRAAWLAVMDQFEGEVDWSGFEEARACLWHRQLHLFLHPLYYIEYGIAQLGALQIWVHARQDQARTLRQYRAALALGGSRPLPELFAAAGCRFDFTAATVRPLIEEVRAAWVALGTEPSRREGTGRGANP